ncbi:hypothetical protein Ciccas_010623, partial [Cichlidogyrus casuarinus]
KFEALRASEELKSDFKSFSVNTELPHDPAYQMCKHEDELALRQMLVRHAKSGLALKALNLFY